MEGWLEGRGFWMGMVRVVWNTDIDFDYRIQKVGNQCKIQSTHVKRCAPSKSRLH